MYCVRIVLDFLRYKILLLIYWEHKFVQHICNLARTLLTANENTIAHVMRQNQMIILTRRKVSYSCWCLASCWNDIQESSPFVKVKLVTMITHKVLINAADDCWVFFTYSPIFLHQSKSSDLYTVKCEYCRPWCSSHCLFVWLINNFSMRYHRN